MEETHEARKYSKFEWFFYLIFIPLLFTAVLSGIILQFFGYNVTGKLMTAARHTPVVKNWVPADASAVVQQSINASIQKQLDDVNNQLLKEKSKETALQSDNLAKTSMISSLKAQIDALQQQINNKQSYADVIAAQVKAFSQMDPEKAATLISALPDDQAKKILVGMKSDAEAAVLEKMDPERASELLKQP